MKRNVINKILFTFICVCLIITIVLAADIGDMHGEGSGGVTDGGNSAGSSSDVTSVTSADEHYVTGIRMMLYTSSGEKLAAKDYVYDRLAGYSLYTQYGNGTPCGKMDGCVNTSWSHSDSYSSATSLNQIFNDYGINIDFNSIILGDNLSKNTLFSQLINSKDIEKAKKLFTALGYDPKNKFIEEKSTYDIFLVWEPLGIIHDKTKGRYYLGTAHELATYLIDNTEELRYYTKNGVEYSGWGGLGKSIANRMGCAVNLEGNSDFQSAVIAKFPENFNSESYFGGKLSLKSIGVVSDCSSQKLDVLRPLANNNEAGFTSPFAIGILWFDDISSNPGLSCYDVDQYYGKYTIQNTINAGNEFDFSEFNTINAGKTFPAGAENGITTNWYKANCMTDTPQPNKNVCITEYNIPNCRSDEKRSDEKTNKSVFYKDTENWDKCVFEDPSEKNAYNITTHKTSASSKNNNNSNLTYYDSNLSSDYCKVYCIEEVYGTFDSNNPTVLAGSHFQWGFSTVKTTRTCKTKSIDWSRFEGDLKAANRNVLIAQAQQLVINAFDKNKWKAGTDVYNDDATCKTLDVDGTTCKEYNDDATYNCTNYTYTDSKTVSGGGQTFTYDFSGSTCVNKNTPPTTVPSNFPKPNVDAAINNVKAKVKKMQSCYSFTDEEHKKLLLNDESYAKISYVSDTYSYTDDMEKSSSSNYTETKNCKDATVDTLSNCTGSTCSGTTSMSKCESYEATGTSNTTFTVKDGVYQYVLKNPNEETLKSIHKGDLSKYESGNFKLNWIDIGYSNFPVPYDISDGYQGQLKIEYGNLGHKKSNSETTDVDKILGSINGTDATERYHKYGDYSDWSCRYTVKTDLIPGPEDKKCKGSKCGDINVIYREIDLYYPFPDTNSGNRSTGANWCDLNSCAWNNKVVEKAILNNRDVTSDDLYGLDPMYTFILKPDDIIAIRRYNNSQDNEYSKYTGTDGAKTYDFKCIEGTGRGCRSDYLSNLLDILDSNQYPGTCKNDRNVYTGDDAETKFESCRYQK